MYVMIPEKFISVQTLRTQDNKMYKRKKRNFENID